MKTLSINVSDQVAIDIEEMSRATGKSIPKMFEQGLYLLSTYHRAQVNNARLAIVAGVLNVLPIELDRPEPDGG